MKVANRKKGENTFAPLGGVPAKEKRRAPKGGPTNSYDTYPAMPRPTQPNSTGPRHAMYRWG